MKRMLTLLLATLMLALMLGAVVSGQVEVPGYVVSDLHLISQESKDDWTPEWTAPIEAATILAWFAEHGFPAFVRDFNSDGVIDELDTIELADLLGRVFMQTESQRGTTDVRLVIGLARYVAERYPNQFVLKIFDSGFRGELQAEEGLTFDPNLIDGIELSLEEDATIADYEYELETGEGVIVGLEVGPRDNTYLAGRSFLYEETAQGYTPVDLAWSEEDYWLSGNQGQVLETIARMDGYMLVDYQGSWTAVECMLALSPIQEFDGTSTPEDCPDDALAYDLMITELGDSGSVQIEECVTREGGVDTYTWTVTNIDFLYNGCGLCLFAIPKPISLAALLHAEPAGWLYSEYAMAWVWRLPLGSCGLLPGDSAVFEVSVPGPTVDQIILGAISTCATVSASGVVTPGEIISVRTTGPGLSDDGCPDLALRILDESCVCDPIDGVCQLRVWVDVANIGSEAVTDPFDVILTSPDHPGGDVETYTLPPALDPGDIWSTILTLNFPMGGELCPTDYVVLVDPGVAPGSIAECDEDNNIYFGSIDCYCGEQEEREACCLPDGSCINTTAPDCAAQGGDFHPGVDCSVVQCEQPEEECPDLIIEITSAYCRNVGATAPYYEIVVETLITNIGTSTVTWAIHSEVNSAWGSDSEVTLTNLGPGDTTTESYVIDVGTTQGGCVDVTATVDYVLQIAECNENNNTDTQQVCCR